MRNFTTDELRNPGLEADPVIVNLQSQFGSRSSLDELVWQGAQRMLQTAIGHEVQALLQHCAERMDADGMYSDN